MSEFTKYTSKISNNKKLTSIQIPAGSKKFYSKGSIIELYRKKFTCPPGTHYEIPPSCVIKSKDRELYSVNNDQIKNTSGKVISSEIHCTKRQCFT